VVPNSDSVKTREPSSLASSRINSECGYKLIKTLKAMSQSACSWGGKTSVVAAEEKCSGLTFERMRATCNIFL